MTASYSHCPTNSLRTTTAASSLTPNQFHKLCPARDESAALGQPQCGDGSPFSFFFARPPARLANSHKVLIEFQGGGACWDAATCGMQRDYLTFPPYYDDFVGKSCSEIEYGVQNLEGVPLSMLCARTLGTTDFEEYNTVIVPYCTQDVHTGDSFMVYEENDGDDDGTGTVRHVGAHNMYRTMQWVFENFPNPTHIFLTGCSAGGTAVPIAYDIINKHYNTFLKGSGAWPRAVNINVIMDSSVYLTPDYFLQHSYANWNPGTIMDKIRFDFQRYQYESNYPDLLWGHILKRGPNSDKWGFVTHSDDPISLMYFQYMSGYGNNNAGRSLAFANSSRITDKHSSPSPAEFYRELSEDSQSLWWEGIQSSMSAIEKKHKNVAFYIINGEGHCSFGLYYPLQDEGFQEWASPIVEEGTVVGNNRPSAVCFLMSVALGGLIVLLIRKALSEKNKTKLLVEDEEFVPGPNHRAQRIPEAIVRIKGFIFHQASKASSWPWTGGYLFTFTIYFICTIALQGFAHPLENPTFGPSAVGLSSSGINNPSLIIYKMEHYRLVASVFLSSGIITYLVVLYSMYKHGAMLESALTENNYPQWVFALVITVISMGANLFYACLGNGASCTSLALVVGLNVFSGILQRRCSPCMRKGYPTSWCFTFLVLIFGSTPLFPFDSVVALSVSPVIGTIVALLLFEEIQSEEMESENENCNDSHSPSSEPVTKKQNVTLRWNFLKGVGITYFVLCILLLFRVPSPDKKNMYPYLTGCSLIYSDQIGDFVGKYASNNDGRALQDDQDLFNGQNMCAQLCIPHLIYRPLVWGVHKLGLIALEEGTCEENGYEEHVADKTVREYSITLEVQVFTQSEE